MTEKEESKQTIDNLLSKKLNTFIFQENKMLEEKFNYVLKNKEPICLNYFLSRYDRNKMYLGVNPNTKEIRSYELNGCYNCDGSIHCQKSSVLK
jgi:hypothetical protein